MKNLKTQLRLALGLSLILVACTGAYSQLTPSADAFTNTATPTSNFGAAATLNVESSSQTAYIQFDLSAIPAGYTGANIADAATLNQTKPAQSQPATLGPIVQEQETVLYTFTGLADGLLPEAGLIRDGEGNLYGTTVYGGDDSGCSVFGNPGCGVVFKLDRSGAETVLYTFTGGADETNPSGLIRDDDGNLYGVSGIFGAGPVGTVFKLAPPAQTGDAWTHTVLYTFCSQPNCTDGQVPFAGPIRDAAGNLYGTTYGGGEGCSGYGGCGVVYKLDRKGNETVLYSFCPAGYGNCTDGAYPEAGLTQDAAGNLYGTTSSGGANQGTVFKLAPPAQQGGVWTETVLYSFTGGTDGGQPQASVILDAAGNLYGTTLVGGDSSCNAVFGPGCGVVFKLAPPAQLSGAWTETVLHAFTEGTDGGTPYAGVIQDAAGNLYGTTWFGGLAGPPCDSFCGVVFKLDTSGNETVLYSFTGTADGAEPLAGVIEDAAGNLYGTASGGGNQGAFCQGEGGCGVVFKLAPAGVSVSPASLNFGKIHLGHHAKRVVTLENQGVNPVEIGPITFSVTTGDASQFSLEHECPAKLGAGKSCTIAAIFTPDAVGADAATLNIVTSAPGSPIEVPITAAGQEQ
jgi:uncharacterized repeat protein (TIGR03803 family)